MKSSVKLLAAGLMLSATFLTPLTVSAAEYGSSAKVTFEAGDNGDVTPVEPTDPVVPITPTDPFDPTNPPKPGTGGALSIDFASSFDFGKQKISPVTKTYTAKAQAYTVNEGTEAGTAKEGPNFVQVTDSRGTLAGWHLTVTQKDQLKTAEANELEGAKISLTNGHIVTATNDENNKPTGVASVDLVPGTAADLMDAKVGAGQGTFLLAWGNDETDGATSVKLEVPGTSIKLSKQYSTDLVWTLTDAPK